MSPVVIIVDLLGCTGSPTLRFLIADGLLCYVLEAISPFVNEHFSALDYKRTLVDGLSGKQDNKTSGLSSSALPQAQSSASTLSLRPKLYESVVYVGFS